MLPCTNTEAIPSHLSLCNPGGSGSVRDTTQCSESSGGNACGIKIDSEPECVHSFRTVGSQSEGFPVRIRSASRRCFVYRPVATNFVPSSIIIERTSSPLLSITVISLRSTTRFPAGGPLRAALQLETNSSTHSFVNRPWRIHLCS